MLRQGVSEQSKFRAQGDTGCASFEANLPPNLCKPANGRYSLRSPAILRIEH
jgi:hypothetical protein